MSRLISLGVRIAAAVALIVATCGYAITGNHTDVLLGAGSAVAIGVGVGLRGGSSGGPWVGILIGSIVGVVTAFLAGALSVGWGVIIPPLGPLAVGLIGGLDRSSLSGYGDVTREMFFVAVLLTLGFIPALVAGDVAIAPVVAAFPLASVPLGALLIGLISRRREGWEDARPPRLLVLGAVALPVLTGLLFAFGVVYEDVGLSGIAEILVIALIVIIPLAVLPLTAFLIGRAAATWLRPRLQVYGQLAAYLRVMWVPIGGFALGYLTIIFLFAGFYGTLERFRPGSFADAGAGLADWVSFAFFTALAQDYAAIVPVSAGARMLVGFHLILSVGWALVLFAAVMTSIEPKLARIARRHAEEDTDSELEDSQ
ncbi:MAG: hypothetical protein OXI39_11740 [Gemmatimonadota bacterium]|uniref:hypothetical protein n=1 Tax=Candidatus Palauibacter scopulicola TaxID=3056741 RepID=UPI0023969AF0|nr:hypothetical protein [Candidatus Palauibacter scopulicola]MDE2663660.1 hypothetical protein [Candidatus Palauibacter scopulicola]